MKRAQSFAQLRLVLRVLVVLLGISGRYPSGYAQPPDNRVEENVHDRNPKTANQSLQMASLHDLIQKERVHQDLRNYHIYAVQHLFGSTVDLFRGLIASGAQPEHIHILGKNYSEHPEVIQELRALGCDVVPTFNTIRVDAQSFSYSLVADSLRFPRAKMMVIDDGGDLISAVHTWIENKPRKQATVRIVRPEERLPYSGNYLTNLALRSQPIPATASMARPKIDPPTDLARRLVAVEQTRRGLTVIERLGPLRFPVVYMGNAWAKIRYESPLIGMSVSKTVVDTLTELSRKGVAGVDPKNDRVRVVILGAGNVGGMTARYMKQLGFDVAVVDPRFSDETIEIQDQRKRTALKRQSIAVYGDKREAFRSFQPKIIISAAGVQTLSQEDGGDIPSGAILINAASAQSEFPKSWHTSTENIRLRGWGDAQLRFQNVSFDIGHVLHPTTWSMNLQPPGTGNELLRTSIPLQGLKGPMQNHRANAIVLSSTHAHRVVTFEGKEFLLLNGGHPINFDGTRDPIPENYIQLTRGLIYLSALQATRSAVGNPRIHTLRRDPQRRFVHAIQTELRQKNLGSLRSPTFFRR